MNYYYETQPVSRPRPRRPGHLGPVQTMLAIVTMAVLLGTIYFTLDALRPDALDLLAQGRIVDALRFALNGRV